MCGVTKKVKIRNNHMRGSQNDSCKIDMESGQSMEEDVMEWTKWANYNVYSWPFRRLKVMGIASREEEDRHCVYNRVHRIVLDYFFPSSFVICLYVFKHLNFHSHRYTTYSLNVLTTSSYYPSQHLHLQMSFRWFSAQISTRVIRVRKKNMIVIRMQ